jgi:hypothetical protein
MSEDVLAYLDSIIAKYQRVPRQEFLLYEAYIDYGYDINGEPESRLVFEVKTVNEKDLSADLMDPENQTPSQPPSKPLRITTLSSHFNPGKKYSVLSGTQISNRARRLKSFLELRLLHPPGVTPAKDSHLALDIDTYAIEDTIPEAPTPSSYRCVNQNLYRANRQGEYRLKTTLNGLRRGSSSSSRIKILQHILFNMGYGDEMRFEKYVLDGRYGKRTALAVAAFVQETDYIEKRSRNYNGEYINTAISNHLIHKCDAQWRRFNFKVFIGSKWILKQRNYKNEMIWLRWRYHTAQLQNELVNLGIATTSGIAFSDDQASGLEDLSAQWEWGKFDQYTDQAVRRFQRAAIQGCRYDPINQIIIYSLQEPTYHGDETGRVDDETKLELIRWFDTIDQLVNVDDVTVMDKTTPGIDLTEAIIEAPMVGCCNLAYVKENTELLISTPTTIDSVIVSDSLLQQNLPYFLFLHRPVDVSRPFLFDNFKSSYTYDFHYKVTNIEKVTDHTTLQFYSGTLNEHKQEAYTAQKVDSGSSAFGSDERGLYQDLYGNQVQDLDASLIAKYLKVYDRQYLGFSEKLSRDNRTLWKVQLKLQDDVGPGIYLFKINQSNDRKPHPIAVFPEDKTKFNILHLTDTHIAARHEEIASYLGESEKYNNPNERLRDIIAMINQGEIEADMIIITGDLVDCANNYRPYDIVDNRHIFAPALDMDANWRLLHYYVTTDPGISVPVYMCLGNHDYRPNPTSLKNYKNDLNISDEEANLYPFDTRDRSLFDEPAQKWLLDQCFSDSLYADKNAAQYYFENICPFTDYKIQIGTLAFFFMDTGMDENIFVSTYGVEDLGMVFKVAFGHNPAPQLIGFDTTQLRWLEHALGDGSKSHNILCLHSPVIQPPLQEMVSRFGGPSFIENEISDAVGEYSESCLIGGRNKLLELISDGKLRLVLTGHTHINVEIRCDPTKTPSKFYVGNYSQNKMNLDYFNQQGNNLLLSTVSSGVVGCEVDIELDNWLDSFEKKDINKYFSHNGFRSITIDVGGQFEDFADDGIWYKHGGATVYADDSDEKLHESHRESFFSLIDNEAMPRIKKSFEIENRLKGTDLAVDREFCELSSIRGFIFLITLPEPPEIKLCMTNKHVSLYHKGTIFDPTFYDIYTIQNEVFNSDRNDPNAASHIKYLTIHNEIIAFTNGEAQSGFWGSISDINQFLYKKRPRGGSHAINVSTKWSSELSHDHFDTPSARRWYDFDIIQIIVDKFYGAPDLYWGPDKDEYGTQFTGDIPDLSHYTDHMNKAWRDWEKYLELKNNNATIPNELIYIQVLDADFSLADIGDL